MDAEPLGQLGGAPLEQRDASPSCEPVSSPEALYATFAV